MRALLLAALSLPFLGSFAQETDATGPESRNHWSVQPVRREFPPGTSVDSLMAEGLAAKGMDLSPEADRRTLIRRLFFDLIGLPPSPERVAAFLADTRPQAYDTLVDELLASPHHGERWARHWLDIAHYADTHGFERDQLRPNAWPYRDYVIDAFNADLPYDQFLREQIAGDVIAPHDPRSVTATGFLSAGPWDIALADPGGDGWRGLHLPRPALFGGCARPPASPGPGTIGSG